MQNLLKLFRRNTKSARTRPVARSLVLEVLEDRTVPSAVRMLPGFSANTLGPNINGSTAPVALGFAVNFGGTVYDHLFVNNNGNVTFTSPSAAATPQSFAASPQAIIAPFFANADTRTTPAVTFGTDMVNGHLAFG